MAAYSPQQSFDKLYARRHYPPDKVADAIVRAVQRGKSIVPVTPESHAAYHLHRLAPALVHWVAPKRDLIN